MKVFVLVLLGFTAISAAPTDVLSNFQSASNQFSADVYKKYKTNAAGNFVICPLSVEILLALIHAGASGNTADELSTALRLPQNREAIDEIYHELHPKLQFSGNYTLQSANKIYVNNGISVREQYKTTAVDVFGASIENIDFSQRQSAVAEINSWVRRYTHEKINELVTERDIAADTRAVLLNAIYFKGTWVNEFEKSETKQRHFYLTRNSYVDVDMMEQTDYFRYFESSTLNAKFIELPYKGDNITMTLVLPNDIEGLPALEEHMHEVVVEPKYLTKRVHLRMPKNKISTFVDLTSVLKSLNISEIFTAAADLKQMLNVNGGPLFISKIIQKALIETDEEGTVAAAATGAFIIAISAPLPPVEFNANHPFIFFLKHQEAGVFFIGRYSSPEGKIVTFEGPIKEEDI